LTASLPNPKCSFATVATAVARGALCLHSSSRTLRCSRAGVREAETEADSGSPGPRDSPPSGSGLARGRGRRGAWVAAVAGLGGGRAGWDRRDGSRRRLFATRPVRLGVPPRCARWRRCCGRVCEPRSISGRTRVRVPFLCATLASFVLGLSRAVDLG